MKLEQNSNTSIKSLDDALETIDTVEHCKEENDTGTMHLGSDRDTLGTASVESENIQTAPYIKIIEQPASKAVQFRYRNEDRGISIIPGVNSTRAKKTYPSIQIEGYEGSVAVVVSCVAKDSPYKPHPHQLVGNDFCKYGCYRAKIPPESRKVIFGHLGIQRVKRSEIEEALEMKEKKGVDPYKTGFSHKVTPIDIDMNVVRLCFEVYREGTTKGLFDVPFQPVVSDPIYNKKALSKLVIVDLSSNYCNVEGGKQIILLCDKVPKEDVQVRFFEKQTGWKCQATIKNIHRQVAISFTAPPYHNFDVNDSVPVFVELFRPSNGDISNAFPFVFHPKKSGTKLRREKKYTYDIRDNKTYKEIQTASIEHGVLQESIQCHGYELTPMEVNPEDRSRSLNRIVSTSYKQSSDTPIPLPEPSTVPQTFRYIQPQEQQQRGRKQQYNLVSPLRSQQPPERCQEEQYNILTPLQPQERCQEEQYNILRRDQQQRRCQQEQYDVRKPFQPQQRWQELQYDVLIPLQPEEPQQTCQQEQYDVLIPLQPQQRWQEEQYNIPTVLQPQQRCQEEQSNDFMPLCQSLEQHVNE
ncbi:embryonic polarity protein dorsal-like [Neodiprion pinetum]|nr:embryonic polarity protein dorsal-like [Neodiprion pinetum]XP_046473590.1 embryonic polarity protein dorsal-like [Neodiprion pinetum]